MPRKKKEKIGKMTVLENRTGRPADEVICISKRDGNKKRPYLILNKLQAKYIPVNPSTTLEMFGQLGMQVDLGEEDPANPLSIIVVGFAETATAIGAEVASIIQDRYPSYNVTFLPTTREVYSVGPDGNEPEKVEFTEDHSHAVEQILYVNDKLLKSANIIIFAEDEVTTGNTICHCVTQLKTLTDANYAVASLMNCMDDNELKRFKDLGIRTYYLLKTDKGGFDEYETEYDKSDELKEIDDDTNSVVQFVTLNKSSYNYHIPNPRFGSPIRSYRTRCGKVAYDLTHDKYLNSAKDSGKPVDETKVLCIGTEECMYPSILLAKAFDKLGFDSYVQATTRVPTCVHVDGEDTLKNRYTVESLYGDRVNYVYNVDEYDAVYVVTDGKKKPNELLRVLESFGNKNITIVYI